MVINLIHLLNDLINEPCKMTSGRILYFKPCAGKTPGGRTKLKEFFRLLKFHIHRNHRIGGKKGLQNKRPVQIVPACFLKKKLVLAIGFHTLFRTGMSIFPVYKNMLTVLAVFRAGVYFKFTPC